MKQVFKSLCIVSAAFASLAVSTESQAIPAFARQMGMACTACHQQHFPVLNAFGQNFKSSGYTMIGSQAKVEDEHLSIPGTLNGAILFKGRYQKTNGTNTGVAAGAAGAGGGAGNNTNNGQWQYGDEFSLFFGGRVAENVGFMFEGNLLGTPGAGNAGNGLAAGIKIPFMYDISNFKVGVIPFSTDALGAAYGFELASTGAVRNVRWAEHRMDISAQQYAATDGAASGLAFVAKHDMGYINFSRWNPNHMIGGNGQANTSSGLSSHYLRAAVTPSVGDWNVMAGVQVWGGQSEVLQVAPVVLTNNVETKATAFDAQAHGVVSGMPLGLYFTYAKSPAGSANANLFNANMAALGGQDLKAWTLGADLSVIPNKAHIGAAIRRGYTGSNIGAGGVTPVAGTNESDNSYSLFGIYDLAQNIALHVNYSKRSGDAYNVNGTGGIANGLGAGACAGFSATTCPGGGGDNLYTFLLEMAW